MVQHLKGLSPLVATAILLAATIAIGYVIYSYAQAGVTAIAQKPQLLITASVDYVGSTAYVEVSVKNTGGAAANITKVSIDSREVTTQLLGAPGRLLEPGQEIRRVIKLDNLPNGRHVVLVELSDGSQFKATFTS